MIAPLFDTCMLCGRPVWKARERLCIFHETRYLIALSAERMKARVNMQRRAQIKFINQPKEIEHV